MHAPQYAENHGNALARKPLNPRAHHTCLPQWVPGLSNSPATPWLAHSKHMPSPQTDLESLNTLWTLVSTPHTHPNTRLPNLLPCAPHFPPETNTMVSQRKKRTWTHPARHGGHLHVRGASGSLSRTKHALITSCGCVPCSCESSTTHAASAPLWIWARAPHRRTQSEQGYPTRRLPSKSDESGDFWPRAKV